MTRKAIDNFRERLQDFVINNGRHLSDVIFKSIRKKCIICTFYKYKNFLCTLFHLIFIDLQNVGVIFAAPCIWSTLSSALHRGHSWRHWWNGNIHSLILKIFTHQPLYPRRKPTRYPPIRKLHEVQSWSEYFVDKKNPFPVLELEFTPCTGKCMDCVLRARDIVKVKVNESGNRPGVAQRVPRGLGFQISWHSSYEVVKSASRTGRLYPQECSWCSFSLGSESTPGPWYGRKEYVTEKSIDTTENRSRDRPTSNAAP